MPRQPEHRDERRRSKVRQRLTVIPGGKRARRASGQGSGSPEERARSTQREASAKTSGPHSLSRPVPEQLGRAVLALTALDLEAKVGLRLLASGGAVSPTRLMQMLEELCLVASETRAAVAELVDALGSLGIEPIFSPPRAPEA